MRRAARPSADATLSVAAASMTGSAPSTPLVSAATSTSAAAAIRGPSGR